MENTHKASLHIHWYIIFFSEHLNRFKKGNPIDLPPSEKYTVTPQDDPEQSSYTCQGFRKGRPSYSKKSEELKTKNLRELLKPGS